MTKAELRDHLKAGYSMDDAFDFVPGQDCDIFKADQFRAGDEIIYIPDVYLNMIPRSTCFPPSTGVNIFPSVSPPGLST